MNELFPFHSDLPFRTKNYIPLHNAYTNTMCTILHFQIAPSNFRHILMYQASHEGLLYSIPPKHLLLVIILVFGLGIVANNVIKGSNIPVEFSLLILTTLAIFITDFKSGLAKYRSKVFLIVSIIGIALMWVSLQNGGI